MALALALGQWLRVGAALLRGLALGLPETEIKVVGSALEEALPLRVVRGLVALAHTLVPTLPLTVAVTKAVGEVELVVVAVGQP